MANGDFMIKIMSVREFREKGFLQEANRQFFHPLGLALQINIDADGNESLGGIWDYRDDPEGMLFDEVDVEKAHFVKGLQDAKAKTRMEVLGFVIQPVPGEEQS